ncbi:TerC/Alx family metal homeostasis membrane protein [Brevibacterium daeguense]|uniref:TerC/Alx family metal homeostasis membrane protein n=1 Tax=Brevibacterium daeguense TaxID=909936 RepID=A0ABP8EN81_9MICO
MRVSFPYPEGSSVTVSPLIWTITVVAIAALLLFDYIFHVRKAHIPTLKEAAVWSGLYVGIALLFGVLVLVFGGMQAGTEYFAGYITEKALSVDNLFVFLIIISSFRVPRENQQKVLLFGITFSLIARTALIFVGAGLINQFAWVFYIFGLILIITAGNMLKPESTDKGEADNFIVRITKKILPTSEHYDGDKMTTTVDGKRMVTPMLLVMIAIAGTDLLFALDSIPAIFGLTQDVYLVFTATAFSLLGLRQLYFLLDGLLDRLVYLSYGLSAILAFIGIKLILHALHENNLPFINDGEPVPVIEISTGTSLLVIVGVLVITVFASIRSPRGRAQAAISGARRDARNYLELDYTADDAERRRVYQEMVENERTVSELPGKYRAMIKEEYKFRDLLSRAHARYAEVSEEPSAR